MFRAGVLLLGSQDALMPVVLVQTYEVALLEFQAAKLGCRRKLVVRARVYGCSHACRRLPARSDIALSHKGKNGCWL